MWLLGHDRFFAQVEAARCLTIHGSLSSGKTIFAHMVAERYLRRGYRFITNVKSVWADEYPVIPMDDGRMKAVVLLDEGGLYVRTFKTVQTIHTFAGKLDTLVIFAGRKEPHEDVQEVRIGEWLDVQLYTGLPIKIFKWDVEKSSGKYYTGFVVFTGWWRYFGVYSTMDPGDYPGSIVRYFVEFTKGYFAKYGRKYELSDVVTGQDSFGEDSAAIFNKAGRRLSEIAVSLQKREKRRSIFGK